MEIIKMMGRFLLLATLGVSLIIGLGLLIAIITLALASPLILIVWMIIQII